MYFVGGLSDDEMIANAILFLVAGYDTTSNTLSFLMYTMATNPEWQDKVFQEIQDNISTNVSPIWPNTACVV